MNTAPATNVLARLEAIARLLPAVKPLVSAFGALAAAELNVAKASAPRLAMGAALVFVAATSLLAFVIGIAVVALREHQVAWPIVAVAGIAVIALIGGLGAWLAAGAMKSVTFTETRARIGWLKDGHHGQ